MAIFLRGAADGLNIVVPFGEKRYRDFAADAFISKWNERIPADKLAPHGISANTTAWDLSGRISMEPVSCLLPR